MHLYFAARCVPQSGRDASGVTSAELIRHKKAAVELAPKRLMSAYASSAKFFGANQRPARSRTDPSFRPRATERPGALR
jgi:hypothetical protein